ncbi:MAG: DUF177 domain-containing protein [Oscillospiraceae bacterium]|nr:DUF177 domain-containing protein [Oscillospiraceae bacterium]
MKKREISVDNPYPFDYNTIATQRGIAACEVLGMRLDLREILVDPSARLPFALDLDTERLVFPSVRSYPAAPHAEGVVFNEAGILRMTGTIDAPMLCICDRCGTEFETEKVTEVDATIVAEESDEHPEHFVLEGTEIDAGEILETCFILDMETKFLCREDCKGLCPRCGSNLNLGPCGCRKEIDPRFAVLEQLLDKE